MKNLFLIPLIILISSGAGAQTWRKDIYGTAGNKGVRTIRIKPAAALTIRTLDINTDTLTYSRTFNGSFAGATEDSLSLIPDNVSDLKILGTGVRYSTTIPGKMYLQPGEMKGGALTLPLSDIDFLTYRNHPGSRAGDIGEGAIFTSLFVLMASPFLCIDYKDGTFNAERYKYWALGSTAALFCSFSVEALFGGQKTFQFRSGWSVKNKTVWSFSRDGH